MKLKSGHIKAQTLESLLGSRQSDGERRLLTHFVSYSYTHVLTLVLPVLSVLGQDLLDGCCTQDLREICWSAHQFCSSLLEETGIEAVPDVWVLISLQ